MHAKEVCRNTKGPVASIYYQGLDRADEGVDAAEKAVVAYGGVQMGQLEKNVSWISLFIAIAPMLGFMGTVIGMIDAFDKIQAAGDMNPSLVAGGIKVALIDNCIWFDRCDYTSRYFITTLSLRLIVSLIVWKMLLLH